jgi:hypothetical protein
MTTEGELQQMRLRVLDDGTLVIAAGDKLVALPLDRGQRDQLAMALLSIDRAPAPAEAGAADAG